MRFHHAKILLLVPLLLTLASLAVMLLWNSVPATLFSLPEIGFWHSLGLLLLCRLLFGGLGLHHGLHGIMGGAHRRLHDRWHSMSPEERRELLKRRGVDAERFRDFHDRFHESFGHPHGHGHHHERCSRERSCGRGHGDGDFEGHGPHTKECRRGRDERRRHTQGRERDTFHGPEDRQREEHRPRENQHDGRADGGSPDAGVNSNPEEHR